MKKAFLIIILITIGQFSSLAQITTNPFNGNVGIGITNPSAKLDVNGLIKARKNINFGSEYNVLVWPPNPTNGYAGGITGNDNQYTRLALYHGHSIDLQTGSNQRDHKYSRLYINSNGNVGIGTRNPTIGFKLSVNGKLRAKEIVVETGWADYVFEENYKLPTLQQVEQHIKEKGHLINIPSAKEVESNGIALGAINTKLLEKIEELTLYTIAQEKEIQTSESRIETIENKNQILEKRMKELEKLMMNLVSASNTTK